MRPNNANEFFYVYSAQALAVAAAALVTRVVSIQADTNFLVQQMTFDVRNAGANVALPNVTVQIVDTSSGMSLFDRELMISLVAGTAQLPFILPTPRIFPAASSIQVNFTNNEGGARDITLTFQGRKYALMNN